MPKKKVAKAHKLSLSSLKHRKSRMDEGSGIYVALGIIVVLLIILLSKLTGTVHVLGAHTGPVLLARGGDDSGGSSGSGGSERHSGEDSNSGGSGSGGSSSGSSQSTGGNANSGSGGSNAGSSLNSGKSSVSNETQVDCVGPDGKHFTTSYKGCSELNSKWHNSNFSFTPLSTPQKANSSGKSIEGVIPTGEARRISPSVSPKPKEVENEVHKPELKNETQDTVERASKEAEIENEDNSETEKPEITRTEDNTFELQANNTKAESEFPISIDETTHTLKVVTSAGLKDVAVLPHQAVNKVLSEKIMTSVETEAQTSSESGGVQKTRLTEINSDPVFEIKGVSQKKVLGIIPVAFAKTTFVSATTGEIVKTDENFLNKVLEAISL